MQDQITQLEQRITTLENQILSIGNFSDLPLELEKALVARGFVKIPNTLGTGVVYSTNGTLSVVTGASGSYYVALVSAGSPTHFIQLTNGVLTTG